MVKKQTLLRESVFSLLFACHTISCGIMSIILHSRHWLPVQHRVSLTTAVAHLRKWLV